MWVLVMRKYWVSGIFIFGGKACADWLCEGCMSKKQAANAVRVWVEGYGCVSAIIREEDTETGEKRVVFAGNFVNYIGERDTSELDRFEKELEEQDGLRLGA